MRRKRKYVYARETLISRFRESVDGCWTMYSVRTRRNRFCITQAIIAIGLDFSIKSLPVLVNIAKRLVLATVFIAKFLIFIYIIHAAMHVKRDIYQWLMNRIA